MYKRSAVILVCILLLTISIEVEAQKVRIDYTDHQDDEAITGGGQHNGAHPEQVLRTYAPDDPGPIFPENRIDYNFLDGEIDALANRMDRFFAQLITNDVDLVVSFTGDGNRKCAYHESPGGSRNVLWDHNDFSDMGLFYDDDLTDVDALEIWGESGPNYPSFFSLEGDPSYGSPPWRVSVFYYDGSTTSTYVERDEVIAQIVMLGFNGAYIDCVDVDALMVRDVGTVGVWDDPDVIIFSIRACGNWDGGEIVVMPASSPSYFLVHGGHTWNTSFAVSSAFGVSTEEVDAIEAYDQEAIPTLTEWGMAVLLLLLLAAGFVFFVRLRRRATT